MTEKEEENGEGTLLVKKKEKRQLKIAIYNKKRKGWWTYHSNKNWLRFAKRESEKTRWSKFGWWLY